MSKIITIELLNNANNANLNRDDLGQVKTASIGGTSRLRISSQCLKRTIRTELQNLDIFKDAASIRSSR